MTPRSSGDVYLLSSSACAGVSSKSFPANSLRPVIPQVLHMVQGGLSLRIILCKGFPAVPRIFP